MIRATAKMSEINSRFCGAGRSMNARQAGYLPEENSRLNSVQKSHVIVQKIVIILAGIGVIFVG
jgi:hypothetical protein